MQTTSPAAVSWQVYVQDHQGSVAVVTDAVGAVVQRLSYDAWGRRRQPNGTEDPSGAITAPTSRGYTDHEHIPGVDLINMNGRVYDPEIARMVSADPLIPELFNTQALNRYSYVYNNPGTFTDPSGYCIDGVSTLACKVIISSAIASIGNFLFGKDEDKKKSAPPPHHAPGLATANEDLRQAEPLYDVSVPTNEVTMIDPGMASSTNAAGYVKGEVINVRTIPIPTGGWSTGGIRQVGIRILTFPGAVLDTVAGATGGVALILITIPTNIFDTYDGCHPSQVYCMGADRGEEKGDRAGSVFPDRELPRDSNGNPVRDPEAEGAYTQLGKHGGRRGKYDQGREWSADGKPVKDIDFTDHGRPKNHTNPHEHPYLPNPTGGTPQHGPARPLKN